MFVYHFKQVNLSRMFSYHFMHLVIYRLFSVIRLHSSDIYVIICIIYQILEFAKLRSTALSENKICPLYLMLCLENVIVNMPITLNLSTS